MIKNRELIYQAFFNIKQDKLYYNQLKELTNLSHSSLQTVLKKLKENFEIIEEKTKGNVFYSLTTKYKAIEFTKITLDKIENLNLDVKIVIKDLIKLIPRNIYTCIFFGSASKKEEQENSDIDLLVVLNSFKNEELNNLYTLEIKKLIDKIREEVEIKSIYPISIVYVNKSEFDEKKDYLIEQAIETGYPIINQLNCFNE